LYQRGFSADFSASASLSPASRSWPITCSRRSSNTSEQRLRNSIPKMYSLNSEASILPRRMSAALNRCTRINVFKASRNNSALSMPGVGQLQRLLIQLVVEGDRGAHGRAPGDAESDAIVHQS
jgi:hypothetical protein